jgi:hypothetical protein
VRIGISAASLMKMKEALHRAARPNSRAQLFPSSLGVGSVIPPD